VNEPLRIHVSPQDLAQIEEAGEWWASHRPAAPGAIRRDLADMLIVLARVAVVLRAFKSDDAEPRVQPDPPESGSVPVKRRWRRAGQRKR
jgi:hypothetical protein